MKQDSDNSSAPHPHAKLVGISPWLPWPLSAWNWCTAPVRAERLAAWRIAVALCVMFDFAYNYLPYTLDFYGKGGLGDPPLFDYRFRSTRMTWSLLRGFVDPANMNLSLLILILMSGWVLCNALSWLLLIDATTPKKDRTGFSLWIWSAAFVWYVAGLWGTMLEKGAFDALAWVVPLLGMSMACLFHAIDIGTILRDRTHRVPWTALISTIVASAVMTVVGFVLSWCDPIDKAAWWTPILKPWQENDAFVLAAMFLLLGAAFLMLIGLQTRFAMVVTWMLSVSFDNSNPYLDNAGDTIRIILLFYLMLCPCGAVWSVDAYIRRRWSPGTAVSGLSLYVHPWVIRLLFVQMIYIYFMNGLYKLLGANWLEGSSLHYVLGDLVITRFSPSMLPLPTWLGRLMTWTVLVWEVTFPLLVLWKWSRRAALVMGVMFHLGIFATMELGGFVPYALCMYIPLLPWGGRDDYARESEASS